MRAQSSPCRLTAIVAIAGLLLAQVPQRVQAQVAPAPPGVDEQQQSADPPGRVGRLARVSGTVSFHAQDENQWTPASLNYPITAGNAFWTQPSAQAEIQVSASRIIMAPGTELDVATLTDSAFQATIPQGAAYLRVRAASPDETYAVQTPRGLVTLASPGRYEVAAGDFDHPTQVTVVEGAAQVTAPGLTLDVAAQQTAVITGTDTFQGQVGPEQPDPFLTAMLDRERPSPQSAAVPPPAVVAMPGGEELAQYGSWQENPDYGQVWYPQVAPDWVPYREGHWAYVGPWGWTWIDSEPWGFAPFHYGRWLQLGGRWGWVPGSYRPVPVYAPALVTFIGLGAVVGVGIGAALAEGRVGWCPLGPREAFHPWYRASDRYFRQVNITHVTNITTVNRNVTINNFVNRRAVTVVPASAMTSSRPVPAFAQRVDPMQLAQARPVIGQQPLRPASTTAGVTPAVVRQLNLPVMGAVRPASPGPAIRPVGLSPGAVAVTRPVLPSLHNPVQPALPASAGTRPFTPVPGAAPGPVIQPPHAGPTMQATPALRPPPAPGQIGPPTGQHQPFVAPGAIPRSPSGPVITPPVATHATPIVPTQQPHVAAPAIHAPPPPVVHVAPPPVAHVSAPPPPQVHAPPPVVHTAPPPPSAQRPAPPPPQNNAQHKRPGEP